MAQLTVKINGYAYTVGCEDGQEQHLLGDGAVRSSHGSRASRRSAARPARGRLLVLAALLMADELHDTGGRRWRPCASSREQGLGGQSGAPAEGAGGDPVAKLEARQAKRLSRLARKAEDIAASIEQP